jgi:aromatic ring-opening dioxygenase catalytic subunit (LigB family)
LLAGLDIPVIPIYVNCRVAPSPSGHRCYAFGTALADILDERTERIAVFASGGLSHDHHGPRAGWVDPPLDEWLLDQVARGRGANLGRLFDVESDSVRGGVAEARLWAIVAAACEAQGSKAKVVDYVPSYAAATGIGFAYWPLDAESV